jgi:SAM-dependent methyltransferase
MIAPPDARGEIARDWADIQEALVRPLWEALLDALKVRDGTTLLDAGAGAGGASVLAQRRGARVTCFDASPALLAIARRRLPGAACVLGDLERLPFNDASFTAVMAVASLPSCPHPLQALRECRRVLVHNGLVAAGVWGQPQECDVHAFLQAVRRQLPQTPAQGDLFVLSGPGELESLLERAGLRCLDRQTVDCPFYYADPETFWRGQRSTGFVQTVIRAAGEEQTKAAVLAAGEPFRTSGGGIRLDNRFRFVVATPAG